MTASLRPHRGPVADTSRARRGYVADTSRARCGYVARSSHCRRRFGSIYDLPDVSQLRLAAALGAGEALARFFFDDARPVSTQPALRCALLLRK